MSEQSTTKKQFLPVLRALCGRILRLAFPAFSPGWMFSFSLFFCAAVLLAMRLLDITASALIRSFGYAALTSFNFPSFFRSWKGYVILVLVLILLGMISGFILNGIILLSDDLLHQKRIRPTRLIRKSVSSIRLFLCKEAVPIILYHFTFVLFITLSLLAFVPNPFEIPGYLRYLLSKKLITMVLYFAVFLLLCIPLVRNPLLLHDILLRQETPPAAKRRTRAFVKAHRRMLFREILGSALLFCLFLLCAAGLFLYAPKLIQFLCHPLPAVPRRVLVLLTTYLFLSILVLTVLLCVWILPLKAALLYHRMVHSSRSPALPAFRIRRKALMACVFLLYLGALALFTAGSLIRFNEIYPPAKYIEPVVHRLGGDLDTENTLEGMEAALALGAPAMETDIQRTKDGHYVIFHDSTLKRMCGLSTSINQLTLEEVRQLKLPSPDFEERHIPLLSQVLDRANGHARLYLELKGADADVKMARDVARMVRERGMEDDCVLISMNYSLISYIAKNLPGTMCGYLYFFAYGTPADLAGNLLLAQSNAISRSRTRAIHSKGKKTYCWTVNSRQTALNMVRQRVDGIITDRYDIVDNVLDHMESRNDYERIMDVLLR